MLATSNAREPIFVRVSMRTDGVSPCEGMPPFTLLHRDARLAAFAKPSGLLVHRGWADDSEVALDMAREALGVRVHPVHRLDRGTSGVLLFALDPECAAALCHLFETGRVNKTYLALVRGEPPPTGTIDSPVPRTEGGVRVPAVTSFTRRASVSQHGRSWSLVEASPHTGRFHQIRRHLKHLGHPIVGDVNYGKGDINRLFREQWSLTRLALHAARLHLSHPFTGEHVSVAAPVPEDLRAPLLRMGFAEEALSVRAPA